jgi:hypothetical protein
MQRAFDLMTFKNAIAQARMAMGADVVGGIDLPFNLLEGNVPTRNLQADHIVLGHAVFSGGVCPSGGVVHGGVLRVVGCNRWPACGAAQFR